MFVLGRLPGMFTFADAPAAGGAGVGSAAPAPGAGAGAGAAGGDGGGAGAGGGAADPGAGGSGAGAPPAKSWRDELPEELRVHPSLQTFKTVADLTKSWVSAQGLIGAEKLPIPQKADDPAWQEVWKRLGRPEKAEGYQLPTLEGIPEGFVTPESSAAFTAMAHAHGLSQRQAAGLYQDYVKAQHAQLIAAHAAQEKAVGDAEVALRTEWGAAYESQKALATKTLRYAFGDRASAIDQKFGHDPDFVRLLVKLGNELSEPILGAGSPKPGDATPDAAQRKINTILADTAHPYHKREHPNHQAAVEDVKRLFELVHGTAEVT